MKILFISSSCSKKKYREVYTMRNKKLIDPQQKFCQLLIDGMSHCEGVEIECLSELPVSASTVSQKVFFEKIEQVTGNLTYKYLAFMNGKILRYITLYRNCKKAVKDWADRNKGENMVILCDALSYFITRPAQKLAAKRNLRIVGIITDLPLLSTSMKERKESIFKRIGLSIFQHLTDKSLSCYDAYIPLTKSIDAYVNPDRKPSLIIEGSVDSGEIKETKPNSKKRVILYAGGVYEKYGIRSLVEAFIKADSNGYELHIYGEGSYVEELKKVAAAYPSVKYMGMVSLDEIVEREKEAMILVNPRPSNEEFSKYSFPSKTLEYMVSGTPLLTTKLPGIPNEYFDYVYTFDGEDVDSMARVISNITFIKEEELEARGHKSFVFVISNKSNRVQGKRIIDFMMDIPEKNI